MAQTPIAGSGLPRAQTASVTCPACRGENPPGMKFCRSCGASLAVVATPMMAPVGGAPMMAPPGPLAGVPPLQSIPPRAPAGSSINCPRCGTATPLGFAYCQNCGLHLGAVVPTDPSGARMRPPTQQPPIVVGAAANLPIDPMAGTLAQPDAARVAAAGPMAAMPPAPAAMPSATPASGPPQLQIIRPSQGQVAGAWGAVVLVNRDGSDGPRYALSSEDTIIGRNGADIAFDDDRFLARQHARIARGADGNVTIHPLDAVNGVFKKAEGPVELADGAVVLVGREVLRFEKVAPEERTITPLIRHGVALFGSPPRDPWGRLVQLLPSGGWRDVRHLVGEEIVLGREEGELVFRDDAFMSRRHAAITWDGKRATLTDLGSSNGTFVRITQPTALKRGDHVRVGDQLLRIEK